MDSSSEIPLKRCSKCKQEKPATTEHFHRRTDRRGGFRPQCKECRSKERAKPRPPQPPRYKDGMKRCIACGEYKLATPEYFYRSKKRPDGLLDRCKKCRKAANPVVPDPNTLKQCRRCKKVYLCSAEYFHVDPAHRDGLFTICKECKNAEQRARRLAHHEEHLIYQRVYYHRWYHANIERVHEHDRHYRQTHPEVVRRRQRKYEQTHQEERRVNCQNRYARQKAVPGTHTAAQIAEQLKRQHYRCYYAACGFSKLPRIRENGTWKYLYEVEHTFPISRVAGMGIPANDMGYLVLACEKCNGSKGKRFPWEWPEGGKLL